MSIVASILRSAYKLSGAKKAFALPEDALRKEIEKQNRHRGVFTPTDRKAYYETIAVNGFLCLIVRENPKPSERAILYFFGGGMVIGPDKGDLPVMRKLCRETGCDVWFPFYPLCMEHCITETYAMVYECYRKMITLYGGVLSGVVEPIGAVLTLLAAQLVIPALPYLLSFAAGAMLYVVVEELIPEMSQGRHSNLGTVFFAVGFSVMMVLDVALG